MTDAVMELSRFNALPVEQAERELIGCCASPAWAREVAAGRPYPGVPNLLATADAALARLDWAGVAEALARHPRIGQRPAGEGRDFAWSRREQSGVADADQATAVALVEANEEYERRFGHLFLIFASGRGPAEILAAARERLGHDDATERQVVRDELAKIVQLRLGRLVAS
ncbi:MAG: uraD [Dactylosporangium sp.]|nr:uraD [Dactylosporangium sp.]